MTKFDPDEQGRIMAEKIKKVLEENPSPLKLAVVLYGFVKKNEFKKAGSKKDYNLFMEFLINVIYLITVSYYGWSYGKSDEFRKKAVELLEVKCKIS